MTINIQKCDNRFNVDPKSQFLHLKFKKDQAVNNRNIRYMDLRFEETK